MTDLTALALARWGMSNARCTFIAGRENQVYRVTGDAGDYALRIRRPNLRTTAEVRSELQWLDAMDRAGLSVPRPEPSTKGAFMETVDGYKVDMVGWMTGQPLGKSRQPLQLDDPQGVFFSLGRDMARLHEASDAFATPDGFIRAHWDIDGLLGEAPVWGRFWDNPTLDEDTRAVLSAFRDKARRDLARAAPDLDYGLIHADLVRENVLLDNGTLRLIDFDDGGYGFRLFDVATALFKNRREPDYSSLEAALLSGYRSVRHLDIAHLHLFMALRAATYVGWIIPRMAEDGAPIRNAGFVAEAHDLCSAYIGQTAST